MPAIYQNLVGKGLERAATLEALDKLKALERKLADKLQRVELDRGYVMTTNPKLWTPESLNRLTQRGNALKQTRVTLKKCTH